MRPYWNSSVSRQQGQPSVLWSSRKITVSCSQTYGNREVQLSPIHKALYLLFLNHPEGIEFKNLVDHREELFALYRKIGNRIDPDKITETVNRLTNPLDNAINEKCSRIKAAFSDLMDEYQADYYIINSHVKRHQGSFMKLWFERLKIINLPRELVVYQ